ncbi:MFS transporter [Pseudomonas sp. LABIM340]|uniref:MFS transporter n=1 Tax=Pseudomonas sp. LABIM340 TaxID=3156585 RepID=UPI0032AFA1B5
MKTNTDIRVLDKAILIFVGSASLIMIGIWPLFMALVAQRLHLDVAQQGWVMTVESLGTVAGTALCAWIARRQPVRYVLALAALASVIANAGTSMSLDLNTVMGLRFLSGAASGLVYSLAVFYLGRMANQDITFGVVLALQTGLFSVYAIAFPLIVERFGDAVAINTIGVWFAAILVVSLALSTQLSKLIEVVAAEHQARNASVSNRAAFTGLIGMAFLQLSIFAIWGYIGNIGAAHGISEVDVGLAFGIGLVGGLPGAALAAVLGSRFGRAPLILVGSGMVLIAVLLLAVGPSSTTELTAYTFLMNVGWVMTLSYYMALISAHDRTGSATSLIGLVQIAGSTLAPFAISLVASGSDLQPVFAISCISAALSAVMPFAITKRSLATQSA